MAEESPLDTLLMLYRELSSKMDTVIAGQSELKHNQSRLEDNQEKLSGDIERVEAQVTELNHTVRGHNGTPGLVAEVAVIKAAIAGGNAKSDKEDDDKEDEKRFLSKDWLLDKLVYIAVAALLYFILTVMPELLGHLGSVSGN